MSSSSLGRVSGTTMATLRIGQDVVGALTEVPYVGGIFQVLEKIGEIRDEVKGNEELCKELLQAVEDYARTLFEALDKLVKSSYAARLKSIDNDLRQFKLILESIVETLSKLSFKRKRDRWKQILSRAQIKGDIEKCERELRRFHERFTIGTLTKLAMDVFEASELSTRRQALAQLSYADRASWNRELCCLDGTRQELLRDIHDRVYPSTEPPTVLTKIIWLEGPAGSGKSAIAHSVAAWAAERDILASSFFLTPGTTTSQASSNQGAAMQLPSVHNLISTLLYDLSRRFTSFADAIAEDLHKTRYLLGDPQRQFTELLMRYSHLLDTSRPLLWVIDGFDELRRLDNRSGGFSTRDILQLWEIEIPKLPINFFLFVTSRPFADPFLSRPPTHLYQLNVDLASTASRQDVVVIARAKIAKLSAEKNIPAWPDEPTLARFVSRAGGLPLWVTVVTNFLRSSFSPEYDLEQILSGDTEHDLDVGTDVTNEMGKIYKLVLNACADWERTSSKKRIGQVLGILLALRRPLSLEALCNLFQNNGLSHTLPSIIQSLRPVLISAESGQPIQFIHLSFRDFLVSPSQKIVGINSQREHATLALHCIDLLKRNLASSAAAFRWKEHEGNPNPPFPGHPNPSSSLIYSSAHLMEHLKLLETQFSDELANDAATFLSSMLLPWLNFQAIFGEYHSVRLVAERMKVLNFSPEQIDQWNVREDVATVTMNVGSWLDSVDRLEEALEAHMDSTEIFRRLASAQPQAFNPDLASSLNRLSLCLSALGFREDALKAIQNAVDLHHDLALEHPQAFNLHLASSLNRLSRCLFELGLRDNALKAVQESVDIFRQLASDKPQTFKFDLATSLNSLSVCLHGLGFREQALQTIQESVELFRQLASESPQTYRSDLAMSLNSLSNRLADIGYQKKALEAIQETVEIRRELVSRHPQAFKVDLARSLNNLSLRLSDLGFLGEALSAIQEAVEVYRPFASERPQAFNPSLANSLSGLSNRLSELAYLEEALKAIQEASRIYRQLASERPHVFNPELSMSLYNLAHRLDALDRSDEALPVINEAVGLYEELAAEQPSLHGSTLDQARSLRSYIQNRLGTYDNVGAFTGCISRT